MPAAKKSAAKPELKKEEAPVFDEPVEPVEEAEPEPAEAVVVRPASAAPEPEPVAETRAGGYVNKAGLGWVLEEE